MKFVLFYHSFASCWNHGNAHFLRGVARELVRVGHGVTVFEPADGWSRTNAARENDAAALAEASALVPGADVRSYRRGTLDLDRALEGADVVLVHEWNEPELVAAIGRCRLFQRFLLLFHDTHHRAVTAPHELERFDLDGYDGVLAFGEVLREIYLARGWGRRVFTWHEAADTVLFRLQPSIVKDTDLVWIGNWGDGEREEELQRFLLAPVARLGITARVHGVRYPEEARSRLERQGIEYAGWLPNHRAAAAFARARVTVHVPRRPYVEALPGIPTIRVFEALACGIPLVSAPWCDTEGLFPPGSFLMVRDGEEMAAALSRVLRDPEFAEELARAGLHAIWTRHTCAHRVKELVAVVQELAGPTARGKLHDSSQEALVAG
jgi:spore maturation protein CgeB